MRNGRRDFLRLLGLGALSGCSLPNPQALPPGELLGMNHAFGHRLLERNFPPPSGTRRIGTLIVGAGISGLGAAWTLARAGQDDFLVIDLEDEAGGNSRAGQLAGISCPWGAHYLPLPGPEAVDVRALLAELDVLRGDPATEKPEYDENYLCAMPQERLYRDGLWEEGLLPQRGISGTEKAQQQRFHEHMARLRRMRGQDGRRLFAIPMALSSRDPEWLALDRKSFAAWLSDNGYDAPSLHWLANYACRDDYGADYRQVSAWAGLHYFASRDGQAANASSDTVLTAPEGNAWLVRGLSRLAGDRITTGSLVWNVEETRSAINIDVWQAGRSLRYQADRLIWAAPLFTLPRVWSAIPRALAEFARAGEYSPWLVANLHLASLPEERYGAPPAWDNVLYDSSSLGYVVATHQRMRRQPGASVLTWYRALHDLTPAAGRQHLLATTREYWAGNILTELETVHPDIRQKTTRLDVFRYGHAMRRPTPGSLFDGRRENVAAFSTPRIALAHADLSGFSLFEEALDRGVRAARHLIDQKKHARTRLQTR